MNDKIRILTKIIHELATTQFCAFGAIGSEDIRGRGLDRSGIEYVHFESKRGHGNVDIGDLVLCQTSGIHDFTVGFVDEYIGYSECAIREIGTNRVSRVWNEHFIKIKGLTEDDLLEGHLYKFKRKVMKAFDWGEHSYTYLFSGIKFEGKNGRTAVIKVRERWSAIKNSKPFDITIKWNTKTTIKYILEEMTRQGYGWKEFEKKEEQNVK